MSETPKISELLRITSKNSAVLYEQVAAHIDQLEEENATLKARIIELEEQMLGE